MLAEFGYGVLVVSFIVAIYSGVTAIYGAQKKSAPLVESARRAMLLTFPLISLSAAVLIYLLINNHFEVAFVYEVTSRSMPTYLKVTAWWGGQAGSLVFWSWLLAVFTSAVTLRKWDRDMPWHGRCFSVPTISVLPRFAPADRTTGNGQGFRNGLSL